MWIFLALLTIPLIEIGLFVQLGGAIGLWLTLAWVVVSAALGIIVLKGIATLGPVSLSSSMLELSDPKSQLAHRVMVTLGGGLLVLPGFLTDTIGLLLLIPPVRQIIINVISRRVTPIKPRAESSQTIEGEWREANPETPANSTNPPSQWTKP